MEFVNKEQWKSLEQWSSALFLFASVILFATALYRGVAYLVEGISFDFIVGNFMLFGRLAVILGLGGLSVQVANRSPRLGKVSRGVVVLAALFTIVLFVLAMLDSLGVMTSSLLAVFGLGTFVLSVATYGFVGVSVLRTGAYSPMIGALLIAATMSLLVVFVGLMFLPSGVIGTIIEGLLAVIYLIVGYRLRTEHPPTTQAEPASGTTAR